MKNQVKSQNQVSFNQKYVFNCTDNTDGRTDITYELGKIQKQYRKNKQNGTSFVFDLDNTLVETNQANNNAYKEAIQAIVGKEISMGDSRFTRSDLLISLPYLTETELDAVIKLKESLYVNHLQETRLNNHLFEMLKQLKESGEETILLTESCENRAKQVCDYYFLAPFFNKKYYREDYENGDKYQFLKENFSIDGSVFLFESEQAEVQRARQSGLCENQIITIKF